MAPRGAGIGSRTVADVSRAVNRGVHDYCTFGDNAALLARYIFQQMKVTMNLQPTLQTSAIVQ